MYADCVLKIYHKISFFSFVLANVLTDTSVVIRANECNVTHLHSVFIHLDENLKYSVELLEEKKMSLSSYEIV